MAGKDPVPAAQRSQRGTQEAIHQRYACDVRDHLLRIDTFLTRHDFYCARREIEALQAIRDRVYGRYRPQLDLLVQANWDRYCEARGIAIRERPVSVRACSAGLPSLGRR